MYVEHLGEQLLGSGHATHRTTTTEDRPMMWCGAPYVPRVIFALPPEVVVASVCHESCVFAADPSELRTFDRSVVFAVQLARDRWMRGTQILSVGNRATTTERSCSSPPFVPALMRRETSAGAYNADMPVIRSFGPVRKAIASPHCLVADPPDLPSNIHFFLIE
jgi:hypothetical protein